MRDISQLYGPIFCKKKNNRIVWCQIVFDCKWIEDIIDGKLQSITSEKEEQMA